MQCFRCVTYHRFIFNMACVGTCECNHMPFPYRSEFLLCKYIDIHKVPVKTVNRMKIFWKADFSLTSLQEMQALLGDFQLGCDKMHV